MWYTVDNVERFGAGWVVRYTVLSLCCPYKMTTVIVQEKKPTINQIKDAIENKRQGVWT
ncbi:hypothetical protein [Sphingobacterium sp. SGG-5]|uniref:hypothetical protein n=1 Tax=Sphingobacterium sp. SGG-5 TaxID=2710881 RepID=UPI0019CF676F|nr:hypothetical protein [Sphingobacterium sp. SGG-5]